jgi:hypothetical protein
MSALAGWSTDIKAAPHGRYVVKQRREGVDQRVFVPERVILTTKCGKVTLSHYLPEEKRWLMLGHGEAPVAWMPWPEPYSAVLPDPHLSVGSNGDPSIPSPEAGGAKMDDAPNRQPDWVAQASVVYANSGQAVPFSRADGGADITMKHQDIRT